MTNPLDHKALVNHWSAFADAIDHNIANLDTYLGGLHVPEPDSDDRDEWDTYAHTTAITDDTKHDVILPALRAMSEVAKMILGYHFQAMIAAERQHQQITQPHPTYA